jgi:hypothetical protein
MVGKNVFENFCVSPLMVFSSCHPLVRDNSFADIVVDDEKQKALERSMLEQGSILQNSIFGQKLFG